MKKEILEKLNSHAQCFSNSQGFTNRERLDTIADILEPTGYQLLQEGKFSAIYSKTSIESLRKADHVVVFSSHVDMAMKKSALAAKGGYFVGSLDNLITNAALLDLMTDEDISLTNCVICFTGEEESGLNLGAREVGAFLAKNRIPFDKTTVAVLDVTYQPANCSPDVTLENLTVDGHSYDTSFFKYLTDDFLGLLKSNAKVCYVGESLPENFTTNPYKGIQFYKSYCAPDEAPYYGLMRCKDHYFSSVGSICLPISGYMHSCSSKVPQSQYEAYTNALLSFSRECARAFYYRIDNQQDFNDAMKDYLIRRFGIEPILIEPSDAYFAKVCMNKNNTPILLTNKQALYQDFLVSTKKFTDFAEEVGYRIKKQLDTPNIEKSAEKTEDLEEVDEYEEEYER